MITTVTAAWVMVPWKIVHSASSLLNFMSGLSIFLAPIAAILACDYWAVKKKAVDVPSLYRRHGRYEYQHGCNWRAAVAFIVSVAPNIPGMAQSVNPSLVISNGIEHVYDINYLWGFFSAFVTYWALSTAFPAKETLLDAPIFEDIEVFDGVEYKNDGVHTPTEMDGYGQPMGTKEANAEVKMV